MGLRFHRESSLEDGSILWATIPAFRREGGPTAQVHLFRCYNPQMASGFLAEQLRVDLDRISEEARTYFQQAGPAWEADRAYSANDALIEAQKTAAQRMREKFASFGANLLAAVKNSPLLEDADETALRRSLRGMSADLSLKEYRYYEASTVSDEDRLYGVLPASQEERDSDPDSCENRFFRPLDAYHNVLG